MKSLTWNKSCARSVRSAASLGMRPNRCPSEIRQERQEIREYLDKLRQLVPACPKDGKLSRLAVIQHVIDYIVELQDTLVHHPVNSILGNEDISDLASLHNNRIFAIHTQISPEMSACLPSNNASSDVVISTKNDTSNSKTTTATTTTNAVHSNNNSNKKSNSSSSNSSTCRRPLGVLSSFKNHRNL